MIALGYTMFGNDAFVETNDMNVPITGKNISAYEDAYNFYLSQLRITIKRAYGILVPCFVILRAPLSMSIKKVTAFVMCLMKLQNNYIDNCGRRTEEAWRKVK